MLGRVFIVVGVAVIVSCGESRNTTELTYQLNLSVEQVADFKTDLRNFAAKNNYVFIDGSSNTKKARQYINRESERSSGKNPGLVSQGNGIIDVTVEPTDSKSEFLIFAKTSAYDASEVTLTIVYDENSLAESKMADDFSHSDFFYKWK